GGAERCHLAGAGGAPVRGAQRRARRFRIVAVAPSRNRDRATSRRSVKTGVHRERSFRARCCSGRGQTWPRRKDASGAWCPPRHSGRTCQPRRAKTSGACGQASAASGSRGKPQEALVKLERRAVVLLEGRVLFGFIEHTVADDQNIQLVTHEATEGIFRRTYDRLAAHVEAGIDEHGASG